MAVNKIARKDSSFRVVCLLPDFCFVPGVAPPIPFPLFTDLGNAKTVAGDVRINRKPAFVFNASKAPKTFGDQPGVRKGVISRTVGGAAWPMRHSSSVKIRSRYIIRTGDSTTTCSTTLPPTTATKAQGKTVEKSSVASVS
ncbi:PAAR-like domain-containing protein [Neisseria dentiae]|uniref:PAAR-like domain-containing protein n=1 Tax=Neisseria dentiae TaxID=194197 RepID=UPI0035A17485